MNIPIFVPVQSISLLCFISSHLVLLVLCTYSWMNERTSTLRRSSLAKTQIDLKKYLARRRFKAAIHSILFVNTFSGANAVFSGRCKRSNIKSLEKDSAEGSSWSDLSKKG